MKDNPNKPQIHEAPLGENTAKYIDRHPNLKSTWEKLNLRIDTEPKKIQTHPDDPLSHVLLGTIGAALAMLGPGAWSVDARLFGWKRIDPPDRKR